MKKERLLSIFAPVVAGLIFLVLSAINLTGSIWFDESYSAYLVRGDFGQIWHETSMDVHPPFFYFALKMWSLLFGTSDIAMRFMSIFFGLIAIVFIYQLLKRYFGVKPASVATLAVSISPMFIRYAQEMRMYTMVLAIVFIATYVLSLALEHKEKKHYWIIYAILVSTGMWTHYFSAFVWIAHLVIIINHFGGIKKLFKDKKTLKTIILTYVLAVALYLPWIPSFFNQIKTVQSGFWIPPISLNTPADFLGNTLFFKDAADVTSWIAILGFTALGLFTYLALKLARTAKKREKQGIKAILIMIGVPILVMTILSLPPLTSSFVDRYVLYSIVSIWILFGLVFALSKERMRKLLATLLIAVAVIGVVNVEARTSKGYAKDIVAEVFQVADEKEPIIAGSVWTYYDGIFYTSEKHPVYLFNQWVNYEYGSLEPIRDYRVNLVDDAEGFLEAYEKVWYITETPEEGSEIEIPDEFKGYRIVSEIALDHHTALEFSR